VDIEWILCVDKAIVMYFTKQKGHLEYCFFCFSVSWHFNKKYLEVDRIFKIFYRYPDLGILLERNTKFFPILSVLYISKPEPSFRYSNLGRLLDMLYGSHHTKIQNS
jgi:hypothetical protein